RGEELDILQPVCPRPRRRERGTRPGEAFVTGVDQPEHAAGLRQLHHLVVVTRAERTEPGRAIGAKHQQPHLSSLSLSSASRAAVCPPAPPRKSPSNSEHLRSSAG